MATTKTIPASYNDLMTQKKALAHLATVMPDGTPQVTPVWFEYTGDKIRINTARGRVKDKNMQKTTAVALSIVDPDNPYRHVVVRGRIVNVIEEGAAAHIALLAKKYLGLDEYPWANQTDVRVIYEIEPTSVSTMG